MVMDPGDGDPEDEAASEGEAGSEAGTEAGPEAGSEAGTEAGSEAGSEADTPEGEGGDSVAAEWEAMLEKDETDGGDDQAAAPAAPATRTAVNLDDPDRVPALYEVELEAYAILGTASMPVSQLLRMGRGAVVELTTHIGDQIDIKVNDVIVARGEVVVVQDRIAVEITEVVAREKD